MEIKKITAEDLVSILDLFESSEEEKEFIEVAEEKRPLYSITIEKLAWKDGEEMQCIDGNEMFSQNTIYECCGTSENESFFDINLVKSDVHQLIQVGELETEFLDDYISFADATVLWGLADRTLRKAVERGKLLEGIDCRKMGRDWICSKAALYREYGQPKEN